MKTYVITNPSKQHALLQYHSMRRERPFEVEIRAESSFELAFDAPKGVEPKELKSEEARFDRELDYQCRALGLALREK